MMRVTISVPPPGPKPTKMRIGLSAGHSAATGTVHVIRAMTAQAAAADMPESVLRGSYTEPTPSSYARWDGVSLGAQFGYSNLTADFADVSAATPFPKVSTNSAQYGGFLGYNAQWDELVLGFEGAYNRANSLSATGVNGALSSTFKLVDYATLRARAGYAFGQFLPYAFFGAAVGRVNYQTPSASRDNGYTAGFTTGLGIDVAILPNVFVRAEYEYALFAPIGFGWQICVALIPGLAAREVAVSALGTVYAMSGSDDTVATQLGPVIAQQWPLATALSLLAWYVFAPQCLSTLAIIRRETNSWKTVAVAAGYLFALAYAASFVTFRIASALT